MKLCQSLFLLLTAVVLSASAVTAQANKIIHKMITPDLSCNKVNFDLQSEDVTIIRTTDSRIEIEMTVTLSTPSDHMLDYLINKGRYNFTCSTNPETSTLQVGQLAQHSKMLTQGGQELRETIKYTIYIPEKIKFIYINHQNIATTNFMAVASAH